ncbi:FAD-dependent monooxygenase, partial [Undibacterium luofuense]
RNNGQEYTISADYLIATDGADSAIRERLGIVREGVGHVQTVRSVLFTCPEADQYLARGAQQFEIEQENFRAFLTTYNDSRWLLMFVDDNERSEDELRAAIRQALG